MYGQSNIVTSPLYQTVRIEDSLIRIKFNNVGKGLIIKNGNELKGFAIAGEDKQFVWAKAMIVGNDEIVVSNPCIKKPVAVRYAWAASPVEANLINKDGLPASPFRTDSWSLSTLNNNDK